MLRDTMDSQLAVIFVALIASACLIFPTLYLAINGVALTAVANESLSYRYFYSLRLMAGDAAGLSLPQGQVLTSLHHLFHLVLTNLAGFPPTDLWPRLEAFGYATLFVIAAFGIGVIVLIATSAALPSEVKVLLCVVIVSFAYASRSGLSAFVTPDYYALEALLTGLSIYLFVYLLRVERIRPVQIATGLGFLAAVMATVKISLLATAFIPILAIGARIYRSGTLVIRPLAAFGLTMLISTTLIIASFYAFRLNDAIASLKLSARFVANPGGEPSFWENLFGSWTGAANPSTGYGYALLLIPICVAIQATSLGLVVRRPRKYLECVLIGSVLSTSIVNLYFIYYRPAGTTLWEAVLHITAATAVALTVIRGHSAYRFLLSGFILVLGVVTVHSLFVNFPWVVDAPRFRLSSAAVREIHQAVQKEPKILMIVPDNNHTTGTVEEGLMKGVSDHPTWNITTGQRLLDIVAPNISFSRDDSPLTAVTAVMWIDVKGRPALSQSMPKLAERVARDASTCRTWHLETWVWWPRMATICSPLGS